MESLFIDSSALFALADEDNPRGKKIEDFLLQTDFRILTTNLVIAETVSLITKRVGKFKAIEVGEKIFTSSLVELIIIDESLQQEAWQLFKKYRDKDFDLIDASSFVICRKENVKEVLTLDRHFSQMGFKVFP